MPAKTKRGTRHVSRCAAPLFADENVRYPESQLARHATWDRASRASTTRTSGDGRCRQNSREPPDCRPVSSPTATLRRLKNARWRDPRAGQNMVRRARSNRIHAASGHRSQSHPHRRGRKPLPLRAPRPTPRAWLRRALGSTNSFFTRPTDFVQSARKRHDTQGHAFFFLPRQSHLAKRGVPVAMGKRLELLFPQLSGICPTMRRRRQTTRALAQSEPTIDG